jgi:alpha-galactosidase
LASIVVCGLDLLPRGLSTKFGIGAGLETCAGYPASLGNEEIDAEAFAEWGIDCMCDPSLTIHK